MANLTVVLENTTSNSTEHQHHTQGSKGPVAFTHFSVAVLCLEAVVGTGLNCLTIMSVVKFRKLWTSPNMLVIALSVNDCLPLLGRIFTVAHTIVSFDRRDLWTDLCLVQTFILLTSHGANVSLISTIAVERATSIFLPVWSRNNVTVKSVQMVALLVWFSDILVVSLQVSVGHKPSSDMTGICSWVDVFTGATLTYSIQFGFILCSMVTLILYFAIIWKAKKMKTTVNPVHGQQSENKNQQKQLRITRMMGTGRSEKSQCV